MDMTAAMELRVKNDQAKAALAATKADLKGVGEAAKEASVDGAKLGPALAGGATKATPAVAGLEAKLEALRAKLMSVTAAEISAQQQTAALAARILELEARLGKGGRGGGGTGAAGAMGNLVAQFNDIGVMMAAGQNPFMLAIQQGSQVTQVIGPLGAAGAAKALGSAFLQMLNPINLVTYAGIAAGAALVQWLFSTEEQAKSAEEAIADLEKAVGQYAKSAAQLTKPAEDIAKQYGHMADEAERAFAAMAKADERDAISKLRVGVEETTGSLLRAVTAREALLGGNQGGKFLLAEDFNLTESAAHSLLSALEALSEAKGPEAQAQAALRVVTALDSARDSAGDLPPVLEAAYSTMAGLAEQASAILGTTDAVTRATFDWAGAVDDARSAMAALVASAPGGGWLAGAIGDASSLATQLWEAARAAAAARGGAVVNANPSAGPVFERRGKDGSTSAPYVAPPLTLEQVIDKYTPKGTGGGRSSGGAGKIDPDSFNALTKAAEDALEKLESAVAGIHEKVRLGLMSTAEGTKAIASAKDQAANSIADLIPKLEKVADAAGPKAAAAVAKWRTEVKGLVGDLSEASAGLGDKLSSNFEKGFADFLSGAKKGKAAMADFKNFVIQQLAAIAAQKFTASIITPFIDSLVGSITGGLLGGTGGGTGSLGLPQPFALGGVPVGPGLRAYSGTIVDKPTFFPMAKGAAVGLMGEAGAEAVMPLARDGSGRLGVRASGGGGDVVVNISTPPGTKASSNERSQGGDRIIDVIIEMVSTAIAGDISQGRGPVPDSMTNTYGLSRVGR